MADKKIYFDHKVITITKSTKRFRDKIADIKVDKFKARQVISILNNFLINSFTNEVLIYDPFPKKVVKAIQSHFHYLEAAGGIVKSKGQVLLIKRFNMWDIPKGKVEKNEKIKSAALREVEEETGVRKVKIVNKAPSTLHIYPYKDGFALKKTYWFIMKAPYKQKLSPQKKENISKAKWVKKEKAKKLLSHSYHSFKDLIPLFD